MEVTSLIHPSSFIHHPLVNALLSVDTVIALTGSALGSGAAFAAILYLLLFSAVVRLFFVRQIARFIKRYPATNIIILTFLSLIGLELISLGLGLRLPELLFSALMLLALLLTILYQLRYVTPRLEPEPVDGRGSSSKQMGG
jgi:predicted tellurium resistance membrane protein TerC